MTRGNTKNNFGQANPGPIGPNGRRVVTTPQQKGKQSNNAAVRVIDNGAGAYITSIEFSEELQAIIVRRGEPVEAKASDTTRFGIVQHTIDHVSDPFDLPQVTDWAKFDTEGNIVPEQSVLLPNDFIHDDEFGEASPWVSNLPSGIGWVRLGAGSDPVGEARWDADLIDTYVTPAENSGAPKRPNLVRAWIVDYSAPAIVVLVFNVPVEVPTRQYLYLKQRYKFTSSKGADFTITAIGAGPVANSLQVTLSRSISVDERLHVRLAQGACRAVSSGPGMSNRASATIPCVPKLARNCYVPVINRFKDGAALSAGTKVAIGSPILIRDQNNGIEIPVYDAVELGGSAETLAYGEIYPARTIIGSLKGCPYRDTPLEEVAAEWDPVTIGVQAFEDGVGVFKPWSSNLPAARKLIINDASHSLFGHDLPAGEPVAIVIGQPVRLLVTGSSPAAYVTLYPVRLP